MTDLMAKPRAEDEDLEELALTEDYGLNPEFVTWVVDAAERGDDARLSELLDALHPADIADLMGFLTPVLRRAVVRRIDAESLAEVLSELDDDLREQALREVTPATLAQALGELDSDDAADVVDDLEGSARAAVLAAMDAGDRAAVERALAYEDETAGRIMQREVLAAPQFWTVGQTIAHVRTRAAEQADDLPDLFFDVYVVDPAYQPVGAVAVSALLKAQPDTPLSAVMEAVTEIPVSLDQEEVAYIFDKYHLISAPVVEPGGRLVGQITVDDIVGVIREESQEDILALAGVSDAGRGAGVLGVMKSRFWWLAINLGTAVLASAVISLFEGAIARLVALAVLMPIVASMGGNAGTQTLAVVVRGLATKELTRSNVLRAVWREAGAGLLNGVIFAVLMAAVVLLWFRDPGLGVVIGAAMVTNLLFASLAGILIPLTLDRMGFDPASSATVFITTVTDVVGFFAFLGLAVLFLL